jgi:hypothetical protein
VKRGQQQYQELGKKRNKKITMSLTYAPNAKKVGFANVQELTVPPKEKDNTLIKLALTGIVIIVLIKILK